MLDAHLAAVRRLPFLTNVRVVALFESNLGTTSSSLAAKLLEDDPTARIVCSNYEQYGVRTASRDAYVQNMRDVLAHERIVYHEQLVSANPWTARTQPAAARATEAKMTQFRQLASFYTELVRDVDGAKRRTRHTVGVHRMDDLALVTVLGVYWAFGYIEKRVRYRDTSTKLARVYSSFAPPAPIVRHSEYEPVDGPSSRHPAPRPSVDMPLSKRARRL